MARNSTAKAAAKPTIKGLERQGGVAKKKVTTEAIVTVPFVLSFCQLGGTMSYYATDYGVLPALRSQPLISGVNGIVQRKDSSYDLTGYLDNCAGAGFYVLPDWESYCVAVDGGYVAAHLVDGHGNIVRQKDADEAYCAWLRGLVESGVLPAPDIDDLSAVAERIRDVASRARKEYATQIAQGEAVEVIDVLTRRLKLVEAEIAAWKEA